MREAHESFALRLLDPLLDPEAREFGEQQLVAVHAKIVAAGGGARIG